MGFAIILFILIAIVILISLAIHQDIKEKKEEEEEAREKIRKERREVMDRRIKERKERAQIAEYNAKRNALTEEIFIILACENREMTKEELARHFLKDEEVTYAKILECLNILYSEGRIERRTFIKENGCAGMRYRAI